MLWTYHHSQNLTFHSPLNLVKYKVIYFTKPNENSVHQVTIISTLVQIDRVVLWLTKFKYWWSLITCVTPAVRQCSKRSLARAAVGELAVLLPTTPAVLAPDANIAGSRLIDLGIRGVLDGELGVANSARKSSAKWTSQILATILMVIMILSNQWYKSQTLDSIGLTITPRASKVFRQHLVLKYSVLAEDSSCYSPIHLLLLPERWELPSLSICCSYSSNCPRKLKLGEMVIRFSFTYLQIKNKNK